MGASSPDLPLRATVGSRSWCKDEDETELYVMNADGTGTRRIAEELDVRGAPAWSPDGQWLAVAVANPDGEPQLFKIPVGGGTPVSLVKEYSTDPIWASERKIPHLFGRGCRHDISGQGGERRRGTLPSAGT